MTDDVGIVDDVTVCPARLEEFDELRDKDDAKFELTAEADDDDTDEAEDADDDNADESGTEVVAVVADAELAALETLDNNDDTDEAADTDDDNADESTSEVVALEASAGPSGPGVPRLELDELAGSTSGPGAEPVVGGAGAGPSRSGAPSTDEASPVAEVLVASKLDWLVLDSVEVGTVVSGDPTLSTFVGGILMSRPLLSSDRTSALTKPRTMSSDAAAANAWARRVLNHRITPRRCSSSSRSRARMRSFASAVNASAAASLARRDFRVASNCEKEPASSGIDLRGISVIGHALPQFGDAPVQERLYRAGAHTQSAGHLSLGKVGEIAQSNGLALPQRQGHNSVDQVAWLRGRWGDPIAPDHWIEPALHVAPAELCPASIHHRGTQIPPWVVGQTRRRNSAHHAHEGVLHEFLGATQRPHHEPCECHKIAVVHAEQLIEGVLGVDTLRSRLRDARHFAFRSRGNDAQGRKTVVILKEKCDDISPGCIRRCRRWLAGRHADAQPHRPPRAGPERQ